MSDYTKQTDFAYKDTLASGHPDKGVVGTEFDDEFNNLETAVNSKYDASDREVANGVAGLDASNLLYPARIPQATTAAVGGGETATDLEAADGTDATKLLTAANLGANGGALKDILALTDPGADRLLFWDETDNAVEWMTISTGLEVINGNELQLSHLGFEDLADPGGDRIVFWDDTTDNRLEWLSVGGGLEIVGNTMSVADTLAGAGMTMTSNVLDVIAGDGIVVNADDVDFAPSAIAGTLDIEGVAQTSDGFVMSDNGVASVMLYQDAGIKYVGVSNASQTFARADGNTHQVLTGISANRTWTVPTDTTAFPLGTVILCSDRDGDGTYDLTIQGTTGVTLTSIIRSAAAASGAHVVLPGGTCALIKVATAEWMIMGDIS